MTTPVKLQQNIKGALPSLSKQVTNMSAKWIAKNFSGSANKITKTFIARELGVYRTPNKQAISPTIVFSAVSFPFFFPKAGLAGAILDEPKNN